MMEGTMLIYRLRKCETLRAALSSLRDSMLQSSLSLPFDYYTSWLLLFRYAA